MADTTMGAGAALDDFNAWLSGDGGESDDAGSFGDEADVGDGGLTSEYEDPGEEAEPQRQQKAKPQAQAEALSFDDVHEDSFAAAFGELPLAKTQAEAQTEVNETEPPSEDTRRKKRTAQDRIRQLTHEKREMMQKLAQASQPSPELVHAFQEQQKELARLQGQLEAMRRPAEEEQLTDIDRAIRSKVAPVIEPYAKKIQELESKLADRDKRDEQREKDAQTQRELQKLSVEAQQSAEQILLAQVPAEQRKAMQKLGKEMTLVFSSIYGVPAHKAAAYAQRYMEAYRQAVNEGAKQTVRQKVQANKAAPQVSTTQRMATREGVLPRLDVSKLQKAGYGGGDLVDSFFDGFNDSFRRLR